MKPAQRQTAEGILFTDAYQLSLAHLGYRLGLRAKQAQLDHFFREYPSCDKHESSLHLNAGLGWLLSHLNDSILLSHPTEHSTLLALLPDQISSVEPLLQPALEKAQAHLSAAADRGAAAAT